MPLRPVVDPTGAGDAFAGGFFGYLDSHCGRRALRRGEPAPRRGLRLGDGVVRDRGLRQRAARAADARRGRRALRRVPAADRVRATSPRASAYWQGSRPIVAGERTRGAVARVPARRVAARRGALRDPRRRRRDRGAAALRPQPRPGAVGHGALYQAPRDRARRAPRAPRRGLQRALDRDLVDPLGARGRAARRLRAGRIRATGSTSRASASSSRARRRPRPGARPTAPSRSRSPRRSTRRTGARRSSCSRACSPTTRPTCCCSRR